jgi:ABC-type amino acid transport substrate-binding protein
MVNTAVQLSRQQRGVRDDVGRRPSEKKTIQVAVRLDEDLLADLDAEIDELRRSSGVTITRSALIKAWLEETRQRRRGKKK